MMNNYKLVKEGKVRKMYEFDDEHLIMFTTDRISAFDVVLPDTIPGKGNVLARLSKFWMHYLDDIVDNHLVVAYVSWPDFGEPGQATLIKKLDPLPVEAIVRGFIIGSGWKEYVETGKICGISLPENMKLAQELPEPIFTPSTKAEVGEHDENISFDNVVDLIGGDLAEQVRDISLKIYKKAFEYAKRFGVLMADTKFEFGLDQNNKLYLIDEVLTPDSSRFWDAKTYKVGISPPSYDKQIVRDYLETLDWDKTPPGPKLPVQIIEKTARQYADLEAKLVRIGYESHVFEEKNSE